MGQDVTKENLSRAVVNFRDEPERIPFDVEHGKLAHSIRRREHLPHLRQIPPSGFPGDAVPDIQRSAEASMFGGCFEQLLPADDVQDSPRFH